jgi:TusA-related sulfurtransferase
MPIVKLSQKMKAMTPGQVLEVQADDRGAAVDIPAWCQKTGNDFLGSEPGAGYTSYFVKKT